MSVSTNEKKIGDKIESKAHLRDTLQQMKDKMMKEKIDYKEVEEAAKRGQLGGPGGAWEDSTGGGKETGSYGGGESQR